ncbi:glycosyltransferase family 9 protein [Pedobacter sp. HMF7647]|uniref:Glycosyltransferase family 9 protein n=1 Tax=Hufsiella arboris TaxID=2695275 RepID=A0A7K1YEU6_9SPHI|nr:glycosyltransferase family 9 protein [Hufsiella arboris]MXV53112.1 glycosyltransferase family 9 protein [Hufsiella arboris]
MQKFLVIQTAFIGDVVLATALLEKLNIEFPGSQIDIVVRKGNETLFTGHPFLTKVWVWDKKHNKTSNLLKLAKAIRKEGYNDVINLQRYFSTGLLTALSGAKTKRGFRKNPLSFLFDITVEHKISNEGTVHEIDRNNLLLETLSTSLSPRPKLYPRTEDFTEVAIYKYDSYICCAPASVWFTKQYPKQYWIEFIKQIPRAIKVYLLGGPGDSQLCQEIMANSGQANVTDLSGKLSFLQSAALMQTAKMNYVNDSAPQHFASAVNAPVTSIYCSTVPAFGFEPLSDNKHIVQIDYSLYCRPCGLHGYKACPQKHFKCAHDIDHKQLIKILDEC